MAVITYKFVLHLSRQRLSVCLSRLISELVGLTESLEVPPKRMLLGFCPYFLLFKPGF